MIEKLDEKIAAAKLELNGKPWVLEAALIGSAMFMPAEHVNDIDFAVRLQPGRTVDDIADTLCEEDGWLSTGDYDTSTDNPEMAWCSVRKGELNYMLTSSQEFYDKYVTAMQVCAALGLADKSDRMLVCRIVRDGRTANLAREELGLTSPALRG